MKRLLLSLLVWVSIHGIAQEGTPELITDRPDQTESSSVVPLGALQIETGFIMENDETGLTKQKLYTVNSTLFRYGLLKNLELRLGLEYLKDRVEIKNPNTVNIISGLSPLYTGFKIKIAGENGWVPEIAFLGGLILPFTADEDYKPSYASAAMRFAFSHTLSDRFSIGYNLRAEWDGESAIPEYFYSLALGFGLTHLLGIYVESYGFVSQENDNHHHLDAGFTYLLLPNLQLDISGGLGINVEAIDNFFSLGLSCRLPY